MRIPLILVAMFIAGCTAAGAGLAEGPAGDSPTRSGDDAFQLKVFKWDGPLNADGHVRLQNPYGDIRARASGHDKLVISAQVQTFTDWQAAPVFDIVETDGVTEVRIEHEQGLRAPYGGDYSSGFAGRVDITLLLPDGARFEATTTDGALRVKGLTGAIKGRTESGEIYYKSSGALDLETDSGRVEAVVRDFESGAPMRIFSVSGPVHLRMTPEVSALVAISTAGKIDTAVMDGVKFRQRRLKDGYEMALGGENRIMGVRSRSGDIKVSVDRSYSTDVRSD